MNKFPAMIAFMTVFLTLYGLLHYYFYRKAVNALHPGAWGHATIIIVLCILMFSPILLHLIEKRDTGVFYTAFAYIGYFWMGILFLAFSIYLVIDIYQAVIFVFSRISSPAILRCMPEARITFFAVLLIIAAINIYGWFEAGNIGIEKMELKTTKLPPGVDSLMVVLIADTHFSATNGLGPARKITGIIEGLRPDLLVSAGDLCDRGIRNRDEIEGLFDAIKTTYGKFAVTGNHEFISGIKESTEFTKNSGFRMLRNEVVEVAGFISIAAVDDPSGRTFEGSQGVSEAEVVAGLTPDHLNIFLKHQPKVEKGSIGRFDIQLSGHAHKGQIFPFTLIVSLFYKYMDGYYELGNGSGLYVSRGTGTWGPPIRFLTFPEITVVEFVRQNG